MWKLGRQSKNHVEQRTSFVHGRAVHRPGIKEDLTPVSNVLLSLGMLPDLFLPIVELLIYPVPGTVMGYSDFVET